MIPGLCCVEIPYTCVQWILFHAGGRGQSMLAFQLEDAASARPSFSQTWWRKPENVQSGGRGYCRRSAI